MKTWMKMFSLNCSQINAFFAVFLIERLEQISRSVRVSNFNSVFICRISCSRSVAFQT
jgi:hypothetical protein